VTQESAEAVLVTGVYGSGKTTAIEEMAGMLEAADVPYAAIDLDWLAWANLDDHGPESRRVLLANLASVVRNFLSAGMTHFLFAGSVDDPGHVTDLAAASDMPMRVVRLTAAIEVIAQRLESSPTTGRLDDLERARADIEQGRGAELGHLVVDGDRPVREVARQILGWLGWLAPA
jgi:energy-coupling factor transporter ATP-binding protein EcfA2